MIYGIRKFTPRQLPTRTIAPMKFPPTTIIPQNNPPGTTPPRELPPMKSLPEFCSQIFSTWDNYLGQLTLRKFRPGQLTRGLLPPNIFP